MRIILFLLIILMIPITVYSESMISDPSPDNATEWKVTLSNGTTYLGNTTSNYELEWNVTDLPVGSYSGDAYFGLNDTWSSPTPFNLRRNDKPDPPSDLEKN